MGSDANYLPVNADAAATLSDPGLIELTAQCQAGVFPSPDEARFIRSPLLDNAVYAVTVGNQQPASAANQIVAQLVPTITPTITLTPSITPVGG